MLVGVIFLTPNINESLAAPVEEPVTEQMTVSLPEEPAPVIAKDPLVEEVNQIINNPINWQAQATNTQPTSPAFRYVQSTSFLVGF